MFFNLMICNLLIYFTSGDNFTSINLPNTHLPFYFGAYPKAAEKCKNDFECPYRNFTDVTKCWGYEYDCNWDMQYSVPSCLGDHRGWVKSKFDQINTFYTQADFGYVKQQIREMKVLCEPLFVQDSSLECSEHLRFCRGRNIMINFTSLLQRDEPLRYKMDVLKEGDIGGFCDFHKDMLDTEADHISALQSWGPELRFFTKLKRPINNEDCDIMIEKPTFIMKIDASVNMYHHFCDFFNLYASLHINSTHHEAFSSDVHILIWESFTYHSNFQPMWSAFTDHPLWDLKTFRGETVCFKNIVFPLLPRMIFGLYYNTPVIYGCEKSGLFRAFAEHTLHRLQIPLHKRKNKNVRITFLSRDTKFRRILNEKELLSTLSKKEGYKVQKIVFDQNVDFKKQLEITHNTDIFIGIHGAGLTHLLFLPEWAAVFEVYNCEDENCYKDLARIRGMKYLTWRNSDKLEQQDEGSHPEGGAHAKFTNYMFDVEEFTTLVEEAAEYVRNHTEFIKFTSSIKTKSHDEL